MNTCTHQTIKTVTAHDAPTRCEANPYQELDDGIAEHIDARRGHPTNSMLLEEMARKLINAGISARTPHVVAWRVIVRRMQAMRQIGRLVFERPDSGGRKRWAVVPLDRTSK